MHVTLLLAGHCSAASATLELAQKCGQYLLIDKVRSEQSVYVMWSLSKSTTMARSCGCRAGWSSASTSRC
ncbi:Transcriptional regulator, AraC family [Pseudomonas chlororaphis]|nr:Transcriptional regulator, AraC family [Pseudomonas chlororaphis]ETD37987.1 hypothetical protein U724_19425 [Pseudomonas chlororaphis subsp. aurantiaca PB-St2]